VLLASSSTSRHASSEPDAIARDLRKLAMLALPQGIQVAYDAQSWGRSIKDFSSAWDVVCQADCPNLGLGLDSFHIFAVPTDLDALEDLDASRIFSGAAVRLHVA
jgi:sugar phosphate isomerase/epimerase